MSLWELISKLGPYFVLSSIAWLTAVCFLAFSVYEAAAHGLRMVHPTFFRRTEAGDVLFRHHTGWARGILATGIASFSLTRVVTWSAHVGFPTGWTRDFLMVHIAVGVVCVVIFFLALFWLTGAKHPVAHHRIVLPGFAAFLAFVFPSGIFFFALILLKVLARKHLGGNFPPEALAWMHAA